MAQAFQFPEVSIQGDRARLLKPYQHACHSLNSLIYTAGSGNGLKADALVGDAKGRIDAWDAAFATLGLRWARSGQTSATDAFLAAFDDDGFIPARLALDGKSPGEGLQRVAAPLTAFAEWELFKLRGDAKRLAEALNLLEVDFDFREGKLRRKSGLFGGSELAYPLGCFTRFSVGGKAVPSLITGADWVDATALHVLNARCLAEMARALERKELAGRFEYASIDIAAKMNARMWDEKEGWYFDVNEHGEYLPVKSLASFWAVVSGVAPLARAERQSTALSDVTRFERMHPYCTLAASEKGYRGEGDRPVGVTRSDFNIVCYETLYALGRAAQADLGAEDHLARVARILSDSGELYTAYDPDADIPAPLADGGSGANSSLTAALAINITLSYLFGLRPHAARKELEVNLRLKDRHSVEGVPFCGGSVSIDAGAQPMKGRRTVEVMCDMPFRLKARSGERMQTFDLTPGSHTVTV
ncbi:MAG: hypothetical protein IT462_04545 [Planctomycetes bacterium]|nr:hypothetical protein [Planctomycetota bacterium]